MSSEVTMTQSRYSWNAPPETLGLANGDVHVWKTSLETAPMRAQELAALLSEDERTRASGFFFERDRSRFIVCRGTLRTILGRYLGVPPGSLTFRYGPHGKPAVATGFGAEALRFNVAHSHGMALYGITVGREIGIDLERVRSDFETDQIAEQCFSRSERAALRALSPERRVEGFFRCWTRKEAYVKARGEGLALPLTRFDVSLAAGEPTVQLSTPDAPLEAARWSLEELPVGPGYIAAIAVEGHDWRLQCWRCPGS